MSGFNDTSDVNNPTFQDKLNEACKSAFKKYSNPPYDSWQELAHEVFIKVCSSKSFAEYRQITNEKGYLYSIAINHLIDKHKSPKTLPGRSSLNSMMLISLTGPRRSSEIVSSQARYWLS